MAVPCERQQLTTSVLRPSPKGDLSVSLDMEPRASRFDKPRQSQNSLARVRIYQ